MFFFPRSILKGFNRDRHSYFHAGHLICSGHCSPSGSYKQEPLFCICHRCYVPSFRLQQFLVSVIFFLSAILGVLNARACTYMHVLLRLLYLQSDSSVLYDLERGGCSPLEPCQKNVSRCVSLCQRQDTKNCFCVYCCEHIVHAQAVFVQAEPNSGACSALHCLDNTTN